MCLALYPWQKSTTGLTDWPRQGNDGTFGLIKRCTRSLRGGICHCRQCRRQCKIFASGVNFSTFTHFLCFFPLKLLKLGDIDGVKFLAWKSGGVIFLTNLMSAFYWDFYLANSLAGCFELGPIVKDCLKNVKTKFASKSNQDTIVWHHNENETK